MLQRIDPLLSGDFVNSNRLYVTSVTYHMKQQKNCVFYVVRAEML
jgi:hypothetical protein